MAETSIATLAPTAPDSPYPLPRVTIRFCTQCKWMLRAAYVSLFLARQPVCLTGETKTLLTSYYNPSSSSRSQEYICPHSFRDPRFPRPCLCSSDRSHQPPATTPRKPRHLLLSSRLRLLSTYPPTLSLLFPSYARLRDYVSPQERAANTCPIARLVRARASLNLLDLPRRGRSPALNRRHLHRLDRLRTP